MPLRQSLVVQDETVAVRHQNVYAIETTSEKNNEMSAERVQTPCTAHDRDEPIVTATQVHRLRGEILTDARRKLSIAAANSLPAR